jgi:hypothetical protein
MDNTPEPKPGYVYILRREDLGLYKIGATRKLSLLLRRLHHTETQSVLFCCQLYDKPLRVVRELRKQYERNLVVCTQWYSLTYPPALPSEGTPTPPHPAHNTADPGGDWLSRHLVKTCTGKRLTASQYRSQYLTRSKHQLYSREFIASRMTLLADTGMLKAIPSPAANARGGVYYTTSGK